MTAFQKTEALLRELTKAEKSQLLQLVASELSGIVPGIEKTEGICGGAARITRTRIPVWSLVNSKKAGMDDADLLREYPTLTADDLHGAWACYRINPEEIDAQIAENELV